MHVRVLHTLDMLELQLQQKSERDITLVGSKADIKAVITAINTAAGTAIATLA